jgi:hypothetical protein
MQLHQPNTNGGGCNQSSTVALSAIVSSVALPEHFYDGDK